MVAPLRLVRRRGWPRDRRLPGSTRFGASSAWGGASRTPSTSTSWAISGW